MYNKKRITVAMPEGNSAQSAPDVMTLLPKARTFEELSEIIYLLEHYAFDTNITHWPENYTTACNDIYGKWEKELEKQHALTVLRNDPETWKTYPLYERFKRLIQREIALVQDIKPQNLLFIGGGPFPISPILYWKYYNISSTCIDSNQEACLNACRIMEKLGLSNKIRISCERGETVNVMSYDLIIVSLLALPKKEILKNILMKIVPQTSVICRTSEKACILLYKPLKQSDLMGWKISKKAEAGLNDTISSLLLEVAKPL